MQILNVSELQFPNVKHKNSHKLTFVVTVDLIIIVKAVILSITDPGRVDAHGGCITWN